MFNSPLTKSIPTPIEITPKTLIIYPKVFLIFSFYIKFNKSRYIKLFISEKFLFCMLNEEQAKVIKEQLIQNIEKSFPEDKKQFAKEQIMSMNPQQLEEFLKKNNIQISETEDSSKDVGLEAQQCVFCSIASGKIDSYFIAEDERAVAALEINPLSKGHTIIIPKVHIPSKEEMSPEVVSFSEKVSEKLKSKLSPKKIETSYSNLFGHEIINLVPVYGEEMPSKKSPAKPEELVELQKTILKKDPEVLGEKKEIIDLDKENVRFPRRIP